MSKQRMISPADLRAPEYVGAPDEAKPLAIWLWLNLDPMGRGPMDPAWIAGEMHRDPGEVETNLIALAVSGFLTTYWAQGTEWILLLHPLKADLRRTKIDTPDPPESPWTSVAVGRGRAGASGRARERAREQVRAEAAARADAWAAVRADREPEEEAPERPMLLDAPPMFCDEHMPYGAGRKKCGPCRDARNVRDEWLASRIYEERIARFNEQQEEEGPW